MRDVYEDITDSKTFFGFAPDYVPFPALKSAGSGRFLVESYVLTDIRSARP